MWHYLFKNHFMIRLRRRFSGHIDINHVVIKRTCACPEKAAQMYFGRISLEHVLEMIDFLQIVQTMIRQVICAELSASSRFYVYRNNAI